jgi:lysophospholipase L1-like esterase
MKRTLVRAASLALGAALFAAGPLSAQITVTKYVALGDSYGAGFGSGCMVTREQAFSYPNQLATAFGITGFQQPTVSDPGLPTCIGVKSLSPLSFGPISTKTGAPTNLTLARPYDNLSVPGFKIADVSDKLTDNGGIADLILRGLGSAQNQALSLNPNFITLGIIGNDILTAGGAGFLLDGVTATPLAVFTAKYNAVAAALKATGRNGVFIGTPYINLIPLASTLPPVVLNPATNTPILVNGQPIPLLGPGNAAFPCPAAQPACPLPTGTQVTLGASAPQAALGGKSLLQFGFGIPCAVAPTLPRCDNPLPDGSFTPPATVNIGVLLYPDEVARIDTRVKDMNAVIQAAAAANGFKYFDFYALGQDLATNGRTYGGVHITKAFVTGGMFAFGEAVHMSNVGYTILADELVQFINTSYGTSFPRPDVFHALFTPDSPAPGTPAILGPPSPESVLFSEEAWHRIFDVYPLQSPEYELVFPGGETVGRIPVRRTEPSGRTPVDTGRSRVRQ